jgi:hypothetical protein
MWSMVPVSSNNRFSVLVKLAILLCLLEKSAWSKIEKTNYRQKEKQVLDSILGKGYDKRIRPSGKNDTDGPATINVNIYLRTISRIDDVKMVRGLDPGPLFFEGGWREPHNMHLNYHYILIISILFPTYIPLVIYRYIFETNLCVM